MFNGLQTLIDITDRDEKKPFDMEEEITGKAEIDNANCKTVFLSRCFCLASVCISNSFTPSTPAFKLSPFNTLF